MFLRAPLGRIANGLCFSPDNVFSIGCLTLSLPESVLKTFKMVLSFESVDEILWCDHFVTLGSKRVKDGVGKVVVIEDGRSRIDFNY